MGRSDRRYQHLTRICIRAASRSQNAIALSTLSIAEGHRLACARDSAQSNKDTATMQNLTESQMEEVLQITAQALRQLNEFWGLKDQVVLRPPAAPQVLSDLAASVRFPLPPSYLRLMSLHDGIDNFYGIRGHLLHSRFRHIFPDFDKEWKRPQMWVFIADNDWNAV